MKRHDQDQMLTLYDQWQASGMSKTEFAVSNGIRPTTFYYWAKKFEQSGTDKASGFCRIPIEERTYNNQGELMAAIHYPSGIRLELYSSFQQLNGSYVQLLKTLAE